MSSEEERIEIWIPINDKPWGNLPETYPGQHQGKPYLPGDKNTEEKKPRKTEKKVIHKEPKHTEIKDKDLKAWWEELDEEELKEIKEFLEKRKKNN